MTYYDSKYNSLTFTIIVIITMFIGIVMSMTYSKSIQHLVVKLSVQESIYKKNIKNIISYYEDSNIIKPYRAKYELYKSPINSVPIKLQLGKITRVNNSNKPKLKLLSVINKDTFETENNNPLIKNISLNYYSFID